MSRCKGDIRWLQVEQGLMLMHGKLECLAAGFMQGRYSHPEDVALLLPMGSETGRGRASGLGAGGMGTRQCC